MLDRVVSGGLQTLPVQPASQGEPLSSTGPALAWCLLVEELAVKREPLLDQVGRLASPLLSQAVVRLTEQAAEVEAEPPMAMADTLAALAALAAAVQVREI